MPDERQLIADALMTTIGDAERLLDVLYSGGYTVVRRSEHDKAEDGARREEG